MQIPSLAKIFTAKLTHPRITRGQVFFTGILAFSIGLLPWFIETPFQRGFFYTIFLSGIFHLLLAIFFGKLSHSVPITLAILSLVNILLTASVVHFTGGVLSPFIFAFFSIIVAEASYGIEYPVAAAMAAFSYLSVIVLEYTRVLTPLEISPAAVYDSPVNLLVVAAVTTTFMVVTGQSYKMIMNSLRDKIEKEHGEKQKILKQFMQMEAPSQVGLLVNKIVHDVRGPVGAVAGFITLLRNENKLSAQGKEDCDMMLTELNRVSALVTQLLHYTKPGHSTKEILCPGDLMRNVISVVGFYPGARFIKFRTHFPESEKFYLFANREELQQVYFNLLKNSIEALDGKESGKTIDVYVEDQTTEVAIRIRDNGRGIPPEILGKITSEMVTTKKEGGGVGLVIVKEILEAYGGRVEIATKEGQWTQISTWLPLHREANVKKAKEESLKNKKRKK